MKYEKLRWACRRGMLELDVLLTNFLEKGYPGLTQSDQALFAELLDEPDPLLFQWLLGRITPEDARFAKMADMIRSYARS